MLYNLTWTQIMPTAIPGNSGILQSLCMTFLIVEIFLEYVFRISTLVYLVYFTSKFKRPDVRCLHFSSKFVYIYSKWKQPRYIEKKLKVINKLKRWGMINFRVSNVWRMNEKLHGWHNETGTHKRSMLVFTQQLCRLEFRSYMSWPLIS